jgi:hypothetical protein
LFTELHEIVFYGGGGYSWWDIYNMPIAIRTFIYSKIEESYSKKNNPRDQDAAEQGKKLAGLLNEDGQVVVPTYITKASKK